MQLETGKFYHFQFMYRGEQISGGQEEVVKILDIEDDGGTYKCEILWKKWNHGMFKNKFRIGKENIDYISQSIVDKIHITKILESETVFYML